MNQTSGGKQFFNSQVTRQQESTGISVTPLIQMGNKIHYILHYILLH